MTKQLLNYVCGILLFDENFWIGPQIWGPIQNSLNQCAEHFYVPTKASNSKMFVQEYSKYEYLQIWCFLMFVTFITILWHFCQIVEKFSCSFFLYCDILDNRNQNWQRNFHVLTLVRCPKWLFMKFNFLEFKRGVEWSSLRSMESDPCKVSYKNWK